ncbi:MAG: hypothetical protein EPN61_17540 [Burkholderiaceae bacterium]|nr:MAG: hypothetical protein EPN61_17540 [Burkholderiaceae bacterium]
MNTNTNTNIDTIKAGIASAEASIAKAQPLADKLAAMQAAAASIKEATETLGILRNRLAEAEQAERNRAAVLQRYSVQSIRSTHEGPAHRHTVTFNERWAGPSGPEVSTHVLALDGLSPELLAVVLAAPNMLPTYILALDSDPGQAVRKHAQAVRRGYLSV